MCALPSIQITTSCVYIRQLCMPFHQFKSRHLVYISGSYVCPSINSNHDILCIYQAAMYTLASINSNHDILCIYQAAVCTLPSIQITTSCVYIRQLCIPFDQFKSRHLVYISGSYVYPSINSNHDILCIYQAAMYTLPSIQITTSCVYIRQLCVPFHQFKSRYLVYISGSYVYPSINSNHNHLVYYFRQLCIPFHQFKSRHLVYISRSYV